MADFALTLKETLEDAIWYGLDAEQGAPHSGVDMTVVVDEVIKYLAHRGYEIASISAKKSAPPLTYDNVKSIS